MVLHAGRLYDLAFGWFLRAHDAELLARAGVGPGDRVLDVGTGPGYLALAASRLVGSGGAAVGVDLSPEMIERARTLAERADSGAEYVVGPAQALPFEDGSFDVVVSRLVVHHLPASARRGAFHEMARVLRPGGRLVVADLVGSLAARAHHVVAHLTGTIGEPEASIEHLALAAGFTDVKTGKLVHGLLAGVAARKPGMPEAEGGAVRSARGHAR